MEFLLGVFLGFVLGFCLFSVDVVKYKELLDEEYIKGFIDFNKKDLNRIKEIDPSLLKKYKIELGE